MASKTINTILNLKDNFSKTLGKTTKSTKEFQRQLKHTKNSISNMKQAVNGAFKSIVRKTALAFGGFQLAQFAKDSIMLASDLAEVQNVVDTTFGQGANTINKFAKTAITNFGLSELQAKKFAGTIGSLGKGMGISGKGLDDMSTGLTGLAGDFASFYNLSPEEAFEKIKAGIVGSSEPLLSLGIDMRDGALSAYALSKGVKKAWKSMSGAEKTQLRYNYLMEKGKLATGDFKKTSGGFANQLRLAQVQIKQLGANIAAKALPHITKLLIKFNGLFQILPKLSDKFKGLGSFLKNNTGMQTLINKTQEAKKRFDEWFKTFKQTDTFRYLMATVTNLVTTFKSKWNDTMESLGTLIEGASKFWDEHGTNIIQTATDIFNIFEKITSIVWDNVNMAITAIGKALAGDWKGAFESLSNTTGSTYNNLQKISDLFTKNSFLQGFASKYLPATAFMNPKSRKEMAKERAANNGSIIDFIKNPKRDWFKFIFTGEIDKYVPKNALGTNYFRGGLTHINERGGEIVDLPNGSKVIPADKSNKLLNSGNQPIISVTIQGNVIGNESYADYVASVIARKLGVIAPNKA